MSWALPPTEPLTQEAKTTPLGVHIATQQWSSEADGGLFTQMHHDSRLIHEHLGCFLT